MEWYKKTYGLLLDYIENITEYIHSEAFAREKNIWAVVIVVVLSILSVFFFKGISSKDNIFFLFSRCFFLIAPLGVFIIIVKRLFLEIDANKALNNKLETLNKLYDSEKHYYESVVANDEEAIRLRQQINQDTKILLKQLEDGEYWALEEYFNSLLLSSEQLRRVNLCGHQVVDSVVGYWQLRSWESNIEFLADIRIDEILINDMDLAIVLGNALENAYAASRAEKVDFPCINLKLRTKDNLLLFVLENSFNGTIICKDENYYSAKRNFEEPGTGLQNIKLLVEKYDGYMKVKPSAERFKLQIALTNRSL